MGLGNRKDKQLIGPDPRNTLWGNSTSKLGFKLLSKMGWSPGEGLGLNADGINTHVAIKMKKNTLGVGADAKTSENWISQTKGFDELLANLNKSKQEEEVESKSASIVSRGVYAFHLIFRHRKKWIQNKSVSSFSSEALNQILGVRTEQVEISEIVDGKGKNMHEYFASKMDTTKVSLKRERSEEDTVIKHTIKERTKKQKKSRKIATSEDTFIQETIAEPVRKMKQKCKKDTSEEMIEQPVEKKSRKSSPCEDPAIEETIAEPVKKKKQKSKKDNSKEMIEQPDYKKSRKFEPIENTEINVPAKKKKSKSSEEEPTRKKEKSRKCEFDEENIKDVESRPKDERRKDKKSKKSKN